jgi:hypothetical protein
MAYLVGRWLDAQGLDAEATVDRVAIDVLAKTACSAFAPARQKARLLPDEAPTADYTAAFRGRATREWSPISDLSTGIQPLEFSRHG